MSLSRLRKSRIGGLINKNLLIQLLLIVITLFVLLQISPYRRPEPGTDSGIFLYIGDQILNGKLPYVDAWDHKGPVIFYLNALGLLIGAGSRWGVWLMEFLAVGGAVLIGYHFLQKSMGTYAAIFGSSAWLLYLNQVIDGGNLTEEYALPLQFATLFFFWRSVKSKTFINDLLLGAVAALAFWLRANIIAIPTAIGLYWIWKAFDGRDGRAWKHLGIIAAGASLLSLIIVIYFWMNAALGGLWDGTFYYNTLYSATTLKQQWVSVLAGFKLVPALFGFALAGWVISLSVLRENRPQQRSLRPIAFVIGIALPLEIVLAGLSGRGFRHYFMSWLPVFSLAAGFFLAYLLQIIKENRKEDEADSLIRPIALSLIIAVSFLPFVRLWPRAISSVEAFSEAGGIPSVDISDTGYAPAIAFIEENVASNEGVIFWGKLLGINWLSDRVVPSRHIFQDHFFTEDYVSADMINEYIEDISNSQAIIIDTLAAGGKYPPIGADLELVPKGVQPLYSYVAAHYQVKEILRPNGWIVYEFSEMVQE